MDLISVVAFGLLGNVVLAQPVCEDADPVVVELRENEHAVSRFRMGGVLFEDLASLLPCTSGEKALTSAVTVTQPESESPKRIYGNGLKGRKVRLWFDLPLLSIKD